MNRTFFFVVLLFSIHAAAQDGEFFRPDSVRKQIAAVEITTSIHMDGILNEPEWQRPKPSPQFVQIEPYQGKAPTYATDVKVLYNRHYIYFGITAHDPLGRKAIRATD